MVPVVGQCTGSFPSSLLCINIILVIHKHVIVTWVTMCTTNLPQKLELTAIDINIL